MRTAYSGSFNRLLQRAETISQSVELVYSRLSNALLKKVETGISWYLKGISTQQQPTGQHSGHTRI